MFKHSWKLGAWGVYIIIIGDMNYFTNIIGAIVNCHYTFSIVDKIWLFFGFNITGIQNLLNSIVFILLIDNVQLFQVMQRDSCFLASPGFARRWGRLVWVYSLLYLVQIQIWWKVWILYCFIVWDLRDILSLVIDNLNTMRWLRLYLLLAHIRYTSPAAA